MKHYIKLVQDNWFLLTELVRKGVRLKYRRSYLGILWSLLEPIMTTTVLVIVFGTLFNRSDKEFPVYIMSGRLLWTYFNNGTKASCKSIWKNRSMITKIYVPKYLYPIADLLFNFLIFLISLTVLIGVMIVARVAPTLHIWQILPALVLLLVNTLGAGLILSTINVFFKDIEYLWNVGLMVIMYMSAIFYPVERIMESQFFWILKINPIFCCIDICRGAVLGYQAPLWDFAYGGGFGLVLVIIGVLLFRSKQDEFVFHL